MNQALPPVITPRRGPQELATKPPPARRLRVYAFDPSLSLSLEHAVLNEVTVSLPWEGDPSTGMSTLSEGPVGEYLEVVDFDPASGCFYHPINLDDPRILAQDGLAPAEGDPRFHQQMVYAVAMTTITHFERALGRVAFWSPQYAFQRRHQWTLPGEGQIQDIPKESDGDYVRRLRVYPHGLREENAYYSPDKVALLFGYFPASPVDTGKHLPGGTVFTCLSHDVIAHETTHALLDGLHPRWDEATNPDVLAFHEAFADIVALFQHFSFPDVLRQQIGRTRGDLSTESLLSQLAIEFGQATRESGGALRYAIGQFEDGIWRPKAPDATALARTTEPHERGSILVAAVFDAFLSIYRARSQDLFRIATGGSGVLPGQLHPDLVNRLANEAAKSARHVLRICIRALDYCPPVDITFGEYLRALITADYEVVSDDQLGYRVAFIESFRWRGIYPQGVRSLSVSNLLWNAPDQRERNFLGQSAIKNLLRRIARDLTTPMARKDLYTRSLIWQERLRDALPEILKQNPADTGLVFGQDESSLEVQSIRLSKRTDPSGAVLNDLVIEVTQSKPAYFDAGMQAESDEIQAENQGAAHSVRRPDFLFHGGCTLIVDPENGRARYCISKSVGSLSRLARQREFMGGSESSLRSLYLGASGGQFSREPFAMLHRSSSEEEL